jgi:VIT1/CCC1 family predicted Fe2+/Mn2+ transporter
MEPPGPADLEREHRPAAVAIRLQATRTSTLSDWVLGAVDGVVTTFAIVAGVVGAGLSAGVVVVLGLANLVADGLSMAASRYLGAQADLERRSRASHRERTHIRLVPEGEREEVRQILAAKGFSGPQLEDAVDVIARDEDTWVEFMLTEELGFAVEPDRPLAAAAATFAGFVVFGALPIAPFIIDVAVTEVAAPGAWSAGLTAAAFMAVGALKAWLVGLPRLPSALRTLAIGGAAASLAFLVGHLLQDLT